jgi:replication factor C subunit 3/5
MGRNAGHRPDLTGPLTIAKPDWETYCHKVADLIVQEQSPTRVMEVRAKFYELLSHCIPPTIILKVCLVSESPTRDWHV